MKPLACRDRLRKNEVGEMKTGCCHTFQNNLEFCISRTPVGVAQYYCIGSNLRPIDTVRSQAPKATRSGRESKPGNVDMIDTDLEIMDRIEACGSRICCCREYECIPARTTPELICAGTAGN